jgi:hypothetical protein
MVKKMPSLRRNSPVFSVYVYEYGLSMRNSIVSRQKKEPKKKSGEN